ncbi:MAG: hypothetical protein AAFX50_18950, partial [Acidobacteriota bacterium]
MSARSRGGTPPADAAGRPARRMQDLLRVSRMIRKVKAKITHDDRETIENKVRRWQQLETPELPADILEVGAQRDWAAVFAAEKARLVGVLGEVTTVG